MTLRDALFLLSGTNYGVSLVLGVSALRFGSDGVDVYIILFNVFFGTLNLLGALGRTR